jgi:hypothetical protein
MVVAKFCNNNKFLSPLAQLSVSKFSRKLERIEIECLFMTFTVRDIED